MLALRRPGGPRQNDEGKRASSLQLLLRLLVGCGRCWAAFRFSLSSGVAPVAESVEALVSSHTSPA